MIFFFDLVVCRHAKLLHSERALLEWCFLPPIVEAVLASFVVLEAVAPYYFLTSDATMTALQYLCTEHGDSVIATYSMISVVTMTVTSRDWPRVLIPK